MGRLRGHMIYKVISTEFLPLRERPLSDPDEDAFLAMVTTTIKTGPMYFSYSFDITNSFQRQAQANLDEPMWKRADDRFFWNKFIQTDLIDFRSGGSGAPGIRYSQQPAVDPYILPVMFGMMRITPATVKGNPFTFALITRRSRHRGGTRYFSRGIDENGNVSNYNETEQVVLLNDASSGPAGFEGGNGVGGGRVVKEGGELQAMSYVQTRGSVPVYWAEVNHLKYTPKLQVRGVETAVPAARKHFTEQINLYGDNYLVNLVNHKGREERVKRAYEDIVRILVSSPSEARESDAITDEKIRVIDPNDMRQHLDKLHYIYFDFHNETKGLKWHRAQLLLDQLRDGLQKGSYFRGAEMPGDPTGKMEIRSTQTAVVRTNCMDCLDRTNVVQSMLGRWALTQQLTDAGILRAGEAANEDAAFEHLFRNVWADNADVVSKSYSGTGALKTDFTRTGERTRLGMAQDFSNSLTRFVKNNFLDGPRQDGFDLLLGTYLPGSEHIGRTLLFVDNRPVVIQAIPYILAAAVFMVFVALCTRRLPDSAVWPLRFFILFWIAVGAWAARFVLQNGMLYVSHTSIHVSPIRRVILTFCRSIGQSSTPHHMLSKASKIASPAQPRTLSLDNSSQAARRWEAEREEEASASVTCAWDTWKKARRGSNRDLFRFSYSRRCHSSRIQL